MTPNYNRIGMIGAGEISNYHLAGLQAARAEVVAISSRALDNARARAQQYGIPSYTADYQAILARDDVGAVVIVTPDFTHQDITIAALEAGKPVLLQKPMARNSEECRAIIAAAEKTGTSLYVSYMHRYFEEVIHVKNLLEQNAFGKIFSVRQRNATPGADWAAWFFHKENIGGGAMMQLGVHGIDLLRHLFGEIEAVKATVALMKTERTLADGTVVQPDNEDLIFATYRFASGMIATHETLYNEVAGTDRFRMEIYGEEGTAWLRTERGDLALYAPKHLEEAGWVTPQLSYPAFGLRQHDHFLRMLRGDDPPDNTAHDGLMAVQVVEAVYRSAETGTWEEVAQS
jgi:predicted dehydrogenase